MRNASGQLKMSGSEKIKANMNTGNKIFGKHIRQFLLKLLSVTRTFDVLVVQNGIIVVQNIGKERQKRALHVQICFLLIIEKKCAARANLLFC